MVFFLAALAIFQPPVEARAAPMPSETVHYSQDRELEGPTGSTEPPSPSKLALIRRYLVLNGTQRQIDTGSFLDRFAFPGGPLSQALSSGRPDITLRDAFNLPKAALLRAYEPHRQAFQAEYEHHLNWEYSEEELRQIVVFLESPAGRHFLTGEWRMNAYVGTNTEEMLDQIVREAEMELRRTPSEEQ